MERAQGLEYEEHGRGETVLLIHGAFVSDALSLVAREPALTKRHRTVWYRRRGYGGSAAPPRPFPIADQAADARSLLRHLGVERAHVVGHSGGGLIAIELALQAPELVRSLVLLEPPILPSALSAAVGAMLAPSVEAYRAGDVGRAVDLFMQQVAPAADWRADLAKALPDAPEQADRDAPTTFEVDLPQIGAWEFDARRAARLAAPVLYVWGSESGALYDAFRVHFLSLVPGAERLELPGVDHGMNTASPRQVAEAVATFLARQR